MIETFFNRESLLKSNKAKRVANKRVLADDGHVAVKMQNIFLVKLTGKIISCISVTFLRG